MSNENTQTNTNAAPENAAPEKMIPFKGICNIFEYRGIANEGFLVDYMLLACMADEKEHCQKAARIVARNLLEVCRGKDVEIPESVAWLFEDCYNKMKKKVETFLNRKNGAEKARAKKCND